MKKQQSEAYKRYQIEKANGKFPYFDVVEICEIVNGVLKDGHLEEALEVLEKGLKLHPNSEELVKTKAQVLVYLNKTEESRAIFEKYKDDGTESTCFLELFLTIKADHNPNLALRKWIAHLKNKHVSPALFIDVVSQTWVLYPDEVKAKHLPKVIHYISNDAKSLKELSNMLFSVGCIAESIDAMERSLDIDAYDVSAWQMLSRVYFTLMDYDKCLEASSFGLAISPDNIQFNFFQGLMLYEKRTEAKKVIAALEKVDKYMEAGVRDKTIEMPLIGNKDQWAMVCLFLARSYASLEKADESLSYYKKLGTLVKYSAQTHFEISQMLLLKGNLNEALAELENCFKTKRGQRNAMFLSLKASILAAMHNFEEALATLDTLIALKPKSINYLLAKGELAAGIHFYEIADEVFQKLLEINPKEEDVRHMIREYFETRGNDEALRKLNGN